MHKKLTSKIKTNVIDVKRKENQELKNNKTKFN